MKKGVSDEAPMDESHRGFLYTFAGGKTDMDWFFFAS
jgi:hypothetical protein